MIKTLIVEDNLNYVKYIINTIINKITDIHIMDIATTIQEAKDIIKCKNIDLIFLDLNLPDAIGTELIDEINYSNFIEKPNIIIVSGELPLIQKIKDKYNFSIVNKLEDTEHIYNHIRDVANNIKYLKNKNKISEEIVSELSKIGYSFKYKGTYYIFDAILYVYKTNNFELLDNLEKNVYKYIAYKYKKSINNIKTNIIKATNLIHKDKYVEENLTPKTVISNILIKLINDYNC